MSGKRRRDQRCGWCGHHFTREGLQAHRQMKLGRDRCQMDTVILPPLQRGSTLVRAGGEQHG